MENQDLANRRLEARLALEGEVRQKRRENENQETESRHREAVRALEGSERHLAREKEEQTAKLAELAVNQAAAAITEKERAAAQAAADKIAAAAQVDLNRRTNITQAEKTIQQIKKTPTNLSGVRTLKTDITEAADQEKISLARIALNTEEKRRANNQEAVRSHRVGRIIFSLIVLLLATGGGLYFFAFSKIKSPANTVAIPNVSKQNSLIFAEKHKGLDLKEASARELKHQIGEEIAALGEAGEILELFFTTNNQPANFRTWQNTLALGRTENFLSAFDNQFMLGIYGKGNGAFLALTPTNYDRAFAGMLTWEKTLAIDLGEILAGQPINPPRDGKFIDKILKNVDVRELDGFAVYGFLDQNLLVIARNNNILAEIIDRYRHAGQ